jgi:hypothetical protein
MTIIAVRCPFWQSGECGHPVRESMLTQLYCDYVHDIGKTVAEPEQCPMHNEPLTVTLENVRMR